MAQITKWGFGSAPQKPEQISKRMASIECLIAFRDNNPTRVTINICDALSEVKGLFNRVARQDQWDWFTVYMYFDYPLQSECRFFVSQLGNLRKAITNHNESLFQESILRLQNSNLRVYLDNYLSFDSARDTGDEYVYVLSRREENELLKIGMTSRNVAKRVKEINSATGVVYPLSPRMVYRVKNGREAESVAHEALKEYRIREDREFFLVRYSEACKIIETAFKERELFYYKYS